MSESCKKSHYPRIEPAVIMLLLSPCKNYALLGRKKNWLKGRYSCLAGFVEVGETLEQAVVRETFEEAGVGVVESSIAYFASQPWPYPSSLMLGFIAITAPSTPHTSTSTPIPPIPVLPSISFDPLELEHVAWFSKSEIKEALPFYLTENEAKRGIEDNNGDSGRGDRLSFPGASSLARTMLTAWIERG